MLDIHQDTIVAIATPPGLGAIGVIRLSGPGALVIASSCFGGKNLSEVSGYTVHFGVLKNEEKDVLDEVIVNVFRGPHSYTGEDVVEFSCHGSPYILSSALQLMLRMGARLAGPGEFTMRAFLNGKMDLAQAEAVADLIASENKISHSMAMKQVRGGFSGEIAALRQELIDFAALIELELDFGEEDVEFADRSKLRDLLYRIRGVIEKLTSSFELGNVLRHGVATVIAGRPNAGKSTLLNALLNEERAIVSDIAGTTRDTISEDLHINGIKFRFVDTAGIRETEDSIESIGVQRALEEISKGALVLYMVDVTTTSPATLQGELESLQLSDDRFIVLLNKMDLNPYLNASDFYFGKLTHSGNVLPMSARNRMNVEALKDMLYHAVVGDPAMLDQTIVTNSRHVDALQRADESLNAVLRGLDSGVSGDFIALDIRQALHHLSSITGSISTDDLLDSIFTRFCIGK